MIFKYVKIKTNTKSTEIRPFEEQKVPNQYIATVR